jgi:integrase/recombinase XerD
MSSIAPHMEAFLREHLARHRGASPHTCDSYAYSFQSLFEFAARKLKAAPSALMLEQLDAPLISAFLEHLETARRNSAQTRNVRLAAIRSFFRFLQHREPAALDQIRRILAIPFKITDTRLVAHLDREELQALLDAPDPSTREGIRDRAMLHLAVCAEQPTQHPCMARGGCRERGRTSDVGPVRLRSGQWRTFISLPQRREGSHCEIASVPSMV